MLTKLKGILSDFFQQADLVLLGLCCVCTVYGIAMIFSATRWTGSNRYIAVQAAALLLGVCAYIFISMVDVEVLASDDTNSAVSGSISGEYVITTSSTPISAGMQVRLSENN